jgi:hypothetical protein
VDDQPGAAIEAVSGEVRLSRVDASTADGQVDVALEDGTRIEGEFSALDCRQ